MELYHWAIFFIWFVGMLAFDLLYVNKKSHQAGLKEAICLSIFYIGITFIFAIGIYVYLGQEKFFLFLTGWIVEKSLSVDNLFVILTIFTYFNVSLKYQHKVLFLGILGALITRGLFIFVGITAINYVHFVIYILGAFLIYTGIKILKGNDPKINPESNFFLKKYHKYFSRYIPLKKDYVGNKFFIKENGIYFITPLLLVLIVIESTDIVFSVDSVPAILSISQDTFIVYTSNIFAILGLRALYFVLATTMTKFAYLNYGVAVVLTFIGIKMILSNIIEIPTAISLIIVAGCLLLSVIASLLWKQEDMNISEVIET